MNESIDQSINQQVRIVVGIQSIPVYVTSTAAAFVSTSMILTSVPTVPMHQDDDSHCYCAVIISYRTVSQVPVTGTVS